WGRVATVLLAALAAAPAAARANSPPPLHDAAGLQVLSAKALDARLTEVTVRTAALPGPTKIRILLPADYAAHPQARYPAFYLLHGTSGGASDWTTMGDA